MKKTISVDDEQYEITGGWSLQGAHCVFKGKVTKFNDPSFSESVVYDIPIGAMRRLTQELMEDDIAISVIEEIKNTREK